MLQPDNLLLEGLRLQMMLQLAAILFNLLPIPGLDGFGIIEPLVTKSKTRPDSVAFFERNLFYIIFAAVLIFRTPLHNFLNSFSSLLGLTP
jgi:Zn-dependent protease